VGNLELKIDQRGLHDITNEMVFKSNPGFIFHDSRGFEAGGTNELNNVKAFITACSEYKNLQNQVHAIWYVIHVGLHVILSPCDPGTASRWMTVGLSQRLKSTFFPSVVPAVVSLHNVPLISSPDIYSRAVPVIAVFTKFDALEMKAYQDLLDKDCPREEAKAQASNYALESIKGHVESLYKKPHPPMGHVYLRGDKSALMHTTYYNVASDMYKPDANCHELSKQTAAVINDDTLQHLFVSTQQNNLELCVEYSIKQWVTNLTSRVYILAKLNIPSISVVVPQFVAATSQPSHSFPLEAQQELCKWFPNFEVITSHS
jgi:hypothetical protein